MQFIQGDAVALKSLNLGEILSDLFIVLNQREQNVLTRRYALKNQPKATLETIGQDLNVTRERVRQIENLAIKKLRRTCQTTAFQLINTLTDNILRDHGGILTEKSLISKILKELNENNISSSTIIRLNLEINSNITKIKKSKTMHTSWHLSSLKFKDIKTIIQSGIKILKNQKKVIEESDFIKQVQTDLASNKLSVNPKTIQFALSTDTRLKLIAEGYGLTSWRHVEPKSIRDKALIILRRTNKPLHFIEIANKISEANFSRKQVTNQAVHNELIRYEDFVLIGRGLYALKEWGYNKGTVYDVLAEILKENGPMKKQDIIKSVLNRRQVKIGTISLNLQKHPEFERVGRALYNYNPSLIQNS